MHCPSHSYDVLTVLQAAPLVWRHTDNSDNREELMPVETLDFDKEREILLDSLKDAEKVGAHIDVVFETATTEALVALLETHRSEALHFSCHGYPAGLCFEDGAGGTHWVDSEGLSELASTVSGGILRFVFVSACFSRAAGEAFVKAGVKHVVCCHQDQQLMDAATIMFSAHFYRALACGKDLQTAFERGQIAVKNCPSILNPEAEMRKFLLLPEGAAHSVDVFYTNKARERSTDAKTSECNWNANSIIPHPPDHFFGREVDVYNILQSLSRFRLVRITGKTGIGKGSLAAAVCHYIKSRRRCFRMENVFWLPLLNTASDSELLSPFSRVFDLIQNNTLEVTLQEDCEFRRLCGIIVEKLYQTHALLAIDARRFTGQLPMEKLSLFLEHVIRATNKVKILLVCSTETQRWWRSPCGVEAKHELGELVFKASALLFGAATPFVAARRHANARTPHRLSNLLVDEGNDFCKVGDSALTKRSAKIFDFIGRGVPARVLEAARTIGSQEFDELIALGENQELKATRVELIRQMEQKQHDIDSAVLRKDFEAASELQDTYNELKALLDSLPSPPELKKQKCSLERNIKVALSRKDYKEAKQLQDSLDAINEMLKKEEEAMCESKPDASPEYQTRVEIDVQFCKLEDELRSATSKGDFPKAKSTSIQLSLLQESRKCFPLKSELQDELHAQTEALEESIEDRKIDTAEVLYGVIEELECQISREETAEQRLGLDDPNQVTLPGAYAVGGKNGNSLPTREGAPNELSWEERSRRKNSAASAAHMQRLAGKMERCRETFETAGSASSSGAEPREMPDDAKNCEDSEEGNGEQIDAVPVGDTYNGENERAANNIGDNNENDEERFGEQAVTAGDTCNDNDENEGADSSSGENNENDRQFPQAECGYGDLPVAAFVVEEASRADSSDVASQVVGPEPNHIPRFAPDGHLMTQEELAVLRRKHGWCPQCGITKTHKKKWLGRRKPLSNSDVRDGRCLRCFPDEEN